MHRIYRQTFHLRGPRNCFLFSKGVFDRSSDPNFYSLQFEKYYLGLNFRAKKYDRHLYRSCPILRIKTREPWMNRVHESLEDRISESECRYTFRSIQISKLNSLQHARFNFVS